MRRKSLALISALMLSGCAASSSVTEQTTPATQAETNQTTTAAETEAEKTTEAETETETEKETEPGVWEPKTPAPVTNAPDEAEVEATRQSILEKGTLLFEGDQNESYYPSEVSWLNTASKDDIVALQYSCDVSDHGGWGVLGLSVNNKQLDIKAYADQPEKVRLLTYTVEELCDMGGKESPEELTFSLGAWNGGHVHGLYYLAGETASELTDYNKSVEEASAIIHTYDGSLSDENAIPEAVAVYDYLKEVWNGQDHCLTGQMESTWKGSADYEMNYINDNSGRLPAIRGLDFMHNDFSGVVKRSIDWWNKGGIVTICWHTGSDFSSAYDESKNSKLDWDNALTPGTDAYNILLKNMDHAVPYLQQLEDEGVPVLWRPFHELDGGWFWWSKGGSENFVKLWQLMYSRYVDYWGLDNLIWVFGYSGNGGDVSSWYPGDDYVDLIGADSYTPGANKGLFNSVTEVAAENMPIVFHECGTIPTEKQMTDAEAPWLFFMTWHTDYITDEKNNKKDSINEIYNSDYFITLDELPSFK